MPIKKNTKIVATLGPASNNKEKISALVKAGCNVFRMNFSHGEHEIHQHVHDTIRQVEQDIGRPIGILADLQGPKIRVATFADGCADLTLGQMFTFYLNAHSGDASGVQLPHPEIFATAKVGDTLLVNDGKIALVITKVTKTALTCQVTTAGIISDRKGVNVPNAVLPISALTQKDREDLQFALSLGVDWVALSFVQTAQDMIDIRKIVGGAAKVLAKIEKPSAVSRIQDIVVQSDGIMVARGDLGVECPLQEVPLAQKKIICACRTHGKPVIVATQMLESMIESPVPTRAEVNDVANAILDGADAIMLSGETAVGAYPVEAVTVMSQIAKRVEADRVYYHGLNAQEIPIENRETDGMANAVLEMSKFVSYDAITTFSTTGTTAVRISRLRPRRPILTITPNIQTARWLNLVWGCYATVTEIDTMPKESIMPAAAHAVNGILKPEDTIIVTAGLPFGTPNKANVMQVIKIADYL